MHTFALVFFLLFSLTVCFNLERIRLVTCFYFSHICRLCELPYMYARLANKHPVRFLAQNSIFHTALSTQMVLYFTDLWVSRYEWQNSSYMLQQPPESQTLSTSYCHRTYITNVIITCLCNMLLYKFGGVICYSIFSIYTDVSNFEFLIK